MRDSCVWRAMVPNREATASAAFWRVSIAQTAGGGRLADRDAAAWNVFPVPLVYECQHDKRYGIQCFFTAAADQSDGSVAGGPQGMASRSPGSAVFYRNSGNDTVSQ